MRKASYLDRSWCVERDVWMFCSWGGSRAVSVSSCKDIIDIPRYEAFALQGTSGDCKRNKGLRKRLNKTNIHWYNRSHSPSKYLGCGTKRLESGDLQVQTDELKAGREVTFTSCSPTVASWKEQNEGPERHSILFLTTSKAECAHGKLKFPHENCENSKT